MGWIPRIRRLVRCSDQQREARRDFRLQRFGSKAWRVGQSSPRRSAMHRSRDSRPNTSRTSGVVDRFVLPGDEPVALAWGDLMGLAEHRLQHGDQVFGKYGLILHRRFCVAVTDAGGHGGDMAVLSIERLATLRIIPRQGGETALDRRHRVWFLVSCNLSGCTCRGRRSADQAATPRGAAGAPRRKKSALDRAASDRYSYGCSSGPPGVTEASTISAFPVRTGWTTY